MDSGECGWELSPEPTNYWVPECDTALKLFVGQCFNSLEDGMQFYKQYAMVVGFDVRKSTFKKDKDGGFCWRSLVCSREGFRKSGVGGVKLDGGDDREAPRCRRRRSSNRVGCIARVGFRRVLTGGFSVSVLEERHNHLLCSEVSRTFLKVNRQLDLGQQTFIANCIRSNIGPVRCFRLYKEFVGEFENVGATCTEFCNFKRYLQAYIEGADAHLLIAKLTGKKEVCGDFFFAYDVDAENRLTRLFWADSVGRRQYTCFGDVISFDATYRTNRYNLVFVPFTGVDNHKRCVTFAAGLLTKEDVDSYVWLLEQFKEAMDHSPSCVVTDQDLALKIVVPRVFTGARHQFCMWHIMTKVGEKVGPILAKDVGFRQKLNALVWNDTLSALAFEVGWQDLMNQYGLGEDRWFGQLFDSHASWVPAFFSDLFMGGLLRTTSRSEAENSFFRRFTNHHSSLI